MTGREHRPECDASACVHECPVAGQGREQTVQYAVLCPRDGKVRDIGTGDPAKAAEWAASRDVQCGRCYPEHGRHVVVSRALTPWEPADEGREQPGKDEAATLREQPAGAALPAILSERGAGRFRLVQDWTGMGLTVQVAAVAAHEGQDVLVWAHSHAMDGPMRPEVEELLDAMAGWAGGYEQVPSAEGERA